MIWPSTRATISPPSSGRASLLGVGLAELSDEAVGGIVDGAALGGVGRVARPACGATLAGEGVGWAGSYKPRTAEGGAVGRGGGPNAGCAHAAPEPNHTPTATHQATFLQQFPFTPIPPITSPLPLAIAAILRIAGCRRSLGPRPQSQLIIGAVGPWTVEGTVSTSWG